jgi:hypothetical protein
MGKGTVFGLGYRQRRPGGTRSGGAARADFYPGGCSSISITNIVFVACQKSVTHV